MFDAGMRFPLRRVAIALLLACVPAQRGDAAPRAGCEAKESGVAAAAKQLDAKVYALEHAQMRQDKAQKELDGRVKTMRDLERKVGAWKMGQERGVKADAEIREKEAKRILAEDLPQARARLGKATQQAAKAEDEAKAAEERLREAAAADVPAFLEAAARKGWRPGTQERLERLREALAEDPE